MIPIVMQWGTDHYLTAMAGWVIRLANHLTIFNFGCVGVDLHPRLTLSLPKTLSTGLLWQTV
jgi:hypothetical protein